MKKRWTLNVLVVALVLLAFTGCGVVTDLILDMRGTWSMTMEDFGGFLRTAPAMVGDFDTTLFVSEQKNGVFKGFAVEYRDFNPENFGDGFDINGVLDGKNVEMAIDFSGTPDATRVSVKLTGEVNKFNSTMSGTYEIKNLEDPTMEPYTGNWTATKK